MKISTTFAELRHTQPNAVRREAWAIGVTLPLLRKDGLQERTDIILIHMHELLRYRNLKMTVSPNLTTRIYLTAIGIYSFEKCHRHLISFPPV
jgi:hypothetical protein